MVDALISELHLRKKEFPSGELQSIYFGGGTPSLLLGDEVSALIKEVHSQFKVDSNAEITLEANPDDLDLAKLSELHANGINRLSIGIQSFNDELLSLMNRAHNVTEANSCLENAAKVGFDELSIDLIYGIPGSSMASWKNDVERAIQYRPKHISSYCLTIESKTAFDHFIKKGKMKAPDEELASRQYTILCEMLADAGYEHYEVSNFCLPGYEAVHNSAYWSGAPYLGLGPSAHSYYDNQRFWNIANNSIYIKEVQAGTPKFESEELKRADRINERIMTGLRTRKGIDLNHMKEKLQYDLLQVDGEKVDVWVSKGWMEIDADSLQPTETGFLWSDHMASELFFVEA